jgi:hypothetical protein
LKVGDQGVEDFPEEILLYSMGTWKFDDMYYGFLDGLSPNISFKIRMLA